MIDFKGQTMLVTGAASGIGLAVLRGALQNGANVVAIDRNMEALTASLEDVIGNRCLLLAADVTNVQQVQQVVAAACENYGRLDALVHSAGIGLEKSFLGTDLSDWQRVIDIDLTGTFITCQAVAQVMADAGYGRIVTLASTAGVRGGTGRAAYGAAKGGVITLTKVMAVELAQYGVTANALAPGAIETDLVKKMHSAETRKVYRQAIPMDRYGTPEEVASAALFLASREAAYISGQVFGVDGGFLGAGVLHRKNHAV
ncbi:SDR family NAD(P)-dependent oxidoreductase [Kordiimonas gwangyangensis]|uniref:SDR family NAD(P)-dependent oxidoreductase n=1 Tax=Kordiimonas gwangyangensis TaxID=288022 RepID=UPI000368B8D7|nr:SDR family NAD(P)-dependent oxidoreductase [Kordiimonas gwangyangensis]